MARVVVAMVLAAADAPPPWVTDAVLLGSTREPLPPYTAPGLAVEYTTPFRRVARAANKAFREGRTLTAAEVDPRAWTPELRVLAGVRPVIVPGKPAAFASPRSMRLTIGAAEVKPTRMETDTASQTVSVGGARHAVTAGLLRAVFEVRGTPPAGGTLEIRYAVSEGREPEIVERVALDFRKTRW